MKLPVAWLKKYIEVTLPPAKLAEQLTLSGSKVETLHDPSGNAVLDIEVTSNRPDCLSILGLATEVSAITGRQRRVPSVYKTTERAAAPKRNAAVTIHIEDKKGCPHYTARVLRNVHVKPSPNDAQRLLASAGTRAISNIVDITNYVLYECGQPMHAFDLDKIRGERIIVRRSKNNEKFQAIDGNEYTLDNETLVIADGERVIAIAGVIGGKTTEVTGSTKNILLESAYFDPVTVRQASKKYKIMTESSYRFERGVNPENVSRASRRGADLMKEWAGAKDVSGLLEKKFTAKDPAKPITLRLKRLEQVVGARIAPNRIVSILKNLSFPVARAGAGALRVMPVISRRDVSKEVDLFEEVLRIEGFDKVGMRLPATHYAFEAPEDRTASGLLCLKRFMASIGFDEIVTYSLLSAKKISDSGIDPAQCHRITNATSAEQEYFRPSLVPGMLEAVLFNVHRKAASLKLFEIGNRYRSGREQTVLSIALYGAMEENWTKKHDAGYFDLKGVIENVLDFLKNPSFEWTPSSSDPLLTSGSDLLVDGRPIATAGEISPLIQSRWDLPHPVVYAEIVLDELFDAEPERFRVRPVAKYPSVRRDIAFIIDNRVSVKDLENAMRNAASPYLHSVSLFDQFTGKNVPSGKRSLAFSLSYQKEDGTFTDEEIQNLQKRLGESLKRLYQVEFR